MLVEFVKSGSIVEPAVGDVIELGVAISNSETGERHLKASANSHRLVCENGAVMSDSLGTAYWPNDPRMTDAGCLRSFSRDLSSLLDKVDGINSLYTSVVQNYFRLMSS